MPSFLKMLLPILLLLGACGHCRCRHVRRGQYVFLVPEKSDGVDAFVQTRTAAAYAPWTNTPYLSQVPGMKVAEGTPCTFHRCERKV